VSRVKAGAARAANFAGLLAAAGLAAAGESPAVSLDPPAPVQGSYVVVRVDRAGAAGRTVAALGREWPLFPDPGGARALVAVPLGTPPGRNTVVVTLPGGRAARGSIQVLPRAARQVRTRALKGLTVSADDAAALKAHKVILGRVLRKTGGEPLWQPGPWRAPVPGPVTSPFGVSRSYGGTAEWPHRGADFGSPAGWPVVAPAAGIVALSRRLQMYGHIVVLDHGQTVHTSYLHLTARQVREGQRVEAGQVLGTVGATGFARGAHLHFGTYVGPVAVDPLDMMHRGLP
jgi:murein DD-endopeptidase MepM/ murein hydrolase activator NlpD